MKFFPIRLIGSSEFVRFHVTVVIGIAVQFFFSRSKNEYQFIVSV